MEESYEPKNPPNHTLYINNLNERVKLESSDHLILLTFLDLKEQLHQLFSAYGKILAVHAKKNIRMRGQAFVVFDDIDVAE